MTILTEHSAARAGPAIPVRQARVPLPVLGELGARATSHTPPPAPAWVHAGNRMLDSHGRTIRDLRISITDRCNFRCVYCMEPDVRFAPREEILTQGEIVGLARIAESLGVRKVRLTGGEPTLRQDLRAIIGGIRSQTSVELAMITNGSLLNREVLREWKLAGLDRVTISIDSLRPDRFARLTRSATPPDVVLEGIEACLAEGLTPLKVNAVLIRGFNDDEAADLAGVARRFGVEFRFIEYMPLDSAHAWDASRMVPAAETRAAVHERFPLVACDDDEPSSTARTYRFADGAPGRIGFIAPVTSPFCGACSRLRLTADGKVRPCLFSTREWDLRPILREGAGGESSASIDERLAAFLIDATWTKQAGHGIASPAFEQPSRPMSAIGG